ncbi:hypothetical protein ACTMU2_23335 [Cupriavidus basilensis]
MPSDYASGLRCPPPDNDSDSGLPAWQQALDALQGLAGGADVLGAKRLDRRLAAGADAGDGRRCRRHRPAGADARGARLGQATGGAAARVAEGRRLPGAWAAQARHKRSGADQSHNRRYVLDRAAAIAALVGYPAVVPASAPEQPSSVAARGARARGRVNERQALPAAHLSAAGREAAPSMEAFCPPPPARDAEARCATADVVLRDGPQRLRAIRFHAGAARRARFARCRRPLGPEAGRAQLDRTLRALAGHFQVEADPTGAVRELEPGTIAAARRSGAAWPGKHRAACSWSRRSARPARAAGARRGPRTC